jgi:hypothetical protein
MMIAAIVVPTAAQPSLRRAHAPPSLARALAAMPTATGLSRLLATSASRAFPRQQGRAAAGRVLLPASSAFGAPLPAGRQLGDSRLFAFSGNGNGAGARGAHTATAAAPRGAGAGSGAAAGKAADVKTTKHAAEDTHELVFEAFEEVQAPLDAVRGTEGQDVSLARDSHFSTELEDAVNTQVNVELTIRRATACACVGGHARAPRARRGGRVLPARRSTAVPRLHKKSASQQRARAQKASCCCC